MDNLTLVQPDITRKIDVVSAAVPALNPVEKSKNIQQSPQRRSPIFQVSRCRISNPIEFKIPKEANFFFVSLDVANSTKLANLAVHSNGTSSTLETTPFDEAIPQVVQALSEHYPAAVQEITSLWEVIRQTPSEIVAREGSRAHLTSSAIGISIALVSEGLKTTFKDELEVKSSGDGVELIIYASSDHRRKFILSSLLGSLNMLSRNLDLNGGKFMVRYAEASTTEEIQEIAYNGETLTIISPERLVNANEVLKHKRKHKPRAKMHMHKDLSRVLESSSGNADLLPEKPLAFGVLEFEIMSPELIGEKLYNLKQDFLSIGFSGVKFGYIQKENAKYQVYCIPIPDERMDLSAGQLVKEAQNIVLLAKANGLKLKLAIGHGSSTKIAEDDIAGHNVNVLARVAYGEENEGVYAAMDFIPRITQEGLSFDTSKDGIIKSKEFKGLGLRVIYNLSNISLEETNLNQRLQELDSIEDVSALFVEHFNQLDPEKIFSALREQILKTLILYSKHEKPEESLDRLKTLVLHITPYLSVTSLGAIIPRIGDAAMKIGLYLDKVGKFKEKYSPDSPEYKDLHSIMGLISATIFGRQFPCRVKTIMSIAHLSDTTTLEKLEELGFIKIEKGLITPDPVIAQYFYIKQEKSLKLKNHGAVTEFLYKEKKWGKLTTEKDFGYLRSFLLHLGSDGASLSTYQRNVYYSEVILGMNFMLENRYFEDFCTLAEPLIDQMSNILEFNEAAVEYRIKLIYSYLRIGRTDVAQKIIEQISQSNQMIKLIHSQPSLIKLYTDLVFLTEPGNEVDAVIGLVENLDMNRMFAYEILELCLEKHNGSIQENVLRKLANHFDIDSSTSTFHLLPLLFGKALELSGSTKEKLIALIFRIFNRTSLLYNFTNRKPIERCYNFMMNTRKPYLRSLGHTYRILNPGKELQKNRFKRSERIKGFAGDILSGMLVAGDHRYASHILKVMSHHIV